MLISTIHLMIPINFRPVMFIPLLTGKEKICCQNKHKSIASHKKLAKTLPVLAILLRKRIGV